MSLGAIGFCYCAVTHSTAYGYGVKPKYMLLFPDLHDIITLYEYIMEHSM